jgi:hypothetical protein
MNLKISLLLTCLLLTTSSFSQDTTKPQFDQLSWLSGCWKGSGFGGGVEECWMQTAGETITGVFQVTRDGQLQFSEIMMIAEFDGNFGMRVKHFDTEFKQWATDEGVGATFPFITMGENHIQFKGLRYELSGDVLEVTLDMKKGEEVRQMKLTYTRNQGGMRN